MIKNLNQFCAYLNVKEGDHIQFDMPGFCSGDYTFEVVKDEYGLLTLKDVPEKIYEGAISYRILDKIPPICDICGTQLDKEDAECGACPNCDKLPWE